MSETSVLKPTGQLHIVLVISSFHPLVGGGEKQAERLGEALVARGNRVTVLTRRAVPDTPREEVRNGVRIVRVSGRGRTGYTLAMLRWIRQNRLAIDVLHAQQSNSQLVVCALAARRWSIPAFCTPMTRWPELQWLQPKGFNWVRRWLYRSTTRWFAKSAEIAEAIGPYAPGRVVRNPNGVDISRFCPTDVVHQGPPVVMFVGRLAQPKRVDCLLEAWRQLQVDACLQIIGDGPMRSAWEEMANSLGLQSVEFLGNRSDIDTLLRTADVFVLPSDYEGMPNSLLEAMSTGLAVVASAVGAVPELLNDGAGIAVNPGSFSELTTALKRLLENPGLRLEMGTRARKRIMDSYSLTAVAERV